MNTAPGRDRTCWLQVTSGRGPAECQLAVTRLSEVIVADASAKGLSAKMIESAAGPLKGCLLSALLSVRGASALRFAETWQGSVLWICRSPFRPSHRRKNWFVGVDALFPPDLQATDARTEDVSFEAMRASGPGGQHVNTTDSAVRALHRPSGVTVVAREERSQHMNRKLALARIAARLAADAEQQKSEAGAARRAKHDRLQRGDAVRTFRGPDFRQVPRQVP